MGVEMLAEPVRKVVSFSRSPGRTSNTQASATAISRPIRFARQHSSTFLHQAVNVSWTNGSGISAFTSTSVSSGTVCINSPSEAASAFSEGRSGVMV